METVPSLMPMLALEMLFTADTWERKRQILEEQQEFLVHTREATEFLDALIKQVHANHPVGSGPGHIDWITQGASLGAYHRLLINARLRGNRQAWAIFMMDMSTMQM